MGRKKITLGYENGLPPESKSATLTALENSKDAEPSVLEDKLDKAIELLMNISDKINRNFEGRISSRTLETETKEEVRKVEKQTTWTSHVPQDFRDIVDDMLTKEFGIQVVPMPDRPAFQFLLTVPEKYSTISKEHKEMYHADVRSRVIDNGEGPAGVRAYVEKVWSSFNPTIQSLIVNDRRP